MATFTTALLDHTLVTFDSPSVDRTFASICSVIDPFHQFKWKLTWNGFLSPSCYQKDESPWYRVFTVPITKHLNLRDIESLIWNPPRTGRVNTLATAAGRSQSIPANQTHYDVTLRFHGKKIYYGICLLIMLRMTLQKDGQWKQFLPPRNCVIKELAAAATGLRFKWW